ncbi:heme-binding protein [Riemerella anatipestifer]|nr:heme-binding protein [Riemerella anatipestifer]
MKAKVFIGILFWMVTNLLIAQTTNVSQRLTQEGALKLAEQANLEAQKLNKKISIAVLDSSGVTLLLLKGDDVGVHNTEASRRKAYTSASTKTSSWDLMQKAASDPTAQNLNTLPELLLLGGGVPIWKSGILVGSIGISGGGSGENDHNIAKKSVENLGFTIQR